MNYSREILDTEARYGIPRGLLLRICARASHGFDDATVHGKGRSPFGAVGIAGLAPQHADFATRCNPAASINLAAQILRSYRERYGSWKHAAVAFRFGPGFAPKKDEARDYIAQLGFTFSLAP